MADIEYQRLTRARSRGIFALVVASRTSLWLGADHLLFVDSNGYSETYKRFYFRDIQAFTMQRSESYLAVNVVLGVAMAFLLLVGLLTPEPELGVFLFSLAGVLAVFVFVNLLRGPSCRCYLRTAVQEEQLPPLSRVRKAKKIFARLRPLIAEAQGGELSTEAIAGRMQEHAGSSPELVAVPPAAPAGDPAPPLLEP